MSDVRKLFENWMKEEFAWELRRTMNLRRYDDHPEDSSIDEYVHFEVQKYYKAFKAAFKIMGEMK